MSELKKVFNKLFAHFGPQGWWPTTRQDKTSPEYIGGPNTEKEKFEVMIGAVLTQNTSWSNVEKAMINLIKKDLINPKRIIDTKDEELAELIKPSGYFNQKTKKIKNLAKFIIENPIKKLEKIETKKLRDVLLSINGVGEETADSIILYALNKPIPVVDAYTKRIFSRIGFTNKNASYKEVQDYQTKNFENEPYHLQELHALLVVLAKEYCTKNNPDCFMCAIYEECKKNI